MIRHSSRRTIFFFQAEDGIRDVAVTGVQTCALPISSAFGPLAVALQILLAVIAQDVVLARRSEEHTSELQSRLHLVCRLLLEKKNTPELTDGLSLGVDLLRHHGRLDCVGPLLRVALR